MSRNRIRNSQSLHWMGVIRWVIIIGIVCVIGLSYMLCQNQNIHLADESNNLEKQLRQIQVQNRDLELGLQRMKTIPELRRRLAQNNSTLVDVNRLACIRLDQSARSRLAQTGLVNSVAQGR